MSRKILRITIIRTPALGRSFRWVWMAKIGKRFIAASQDLSSRKLAVRSAMDMLAAIQESRYEVRMEE